MTASSSRRSCRPLRRSPRARADGQHRRSQGGRYLRGRARRRQGRRDHAGRRAVRADPALGRHRAPAPAHWAPGHDARDRHGSRRRPLEDGATIPLAQTKPNVQPDQILASLDGDTRAYLQLLIQGAPRVSVGGAALRRPAPLRAAGPLPGADRQRAGRAAPQHRQRDHQPGARRARQGRHSLSEWVSSQSAALGAFANQEAAIRRRCASCPRP